MGFSLGGLISGAMKGVGEGMSTVAKGELENQQKLEYQKEILRLTEEKDRRVAEFTQDLNIRGKIREINEVDPLKITSDANRARVIGGVETDVLTDRETRMGPIKAANEGLATGARVTAEGKAITDLSKDKNYIAALQTISNAKEGSAAKAQAAGVMFELGQKKAIADLRTQLSKLPKDDPQREALTQRISDLSGASIKSASDVISAATNWRMMAKDLRKDAESAGTDEEREALRGQAQQYEQLADSIQRTIVNQRVPGANVPRTGGPAGARTTTPAPAAPWTRNWNQDGNIGNNPAP